MLFVYKENELILGTENIPDLMMDLISGIREVAKSFYNDELVYVEKENLSITSYCSVTEVMLLWLSKEKGVKDLKKYYELYAKAMIYDDLTLFKTWVETCRD